MFLRGYGGVGVVFGGLLGWSGELWEIMNCYSDFGE